MFSVRPSFVEICRLFPRSLACSRTNTETAFAMKTSSLMTRLLYHRLPHAQSFQLQGVRHVSSQNSSNNESVFAILTQRKGYDEEVARGIVRALESSFGKGKANEQVLSSFGDAGLESLARAVKVELAAKVSDFVGTVHFIVPHHNYSFDMEMPEGQSLMELSKTEIGHEMLGEYLECACGGNMSCATCHVILDQKTYDTLEKPGRAEKDMLDLAYEPTNTSRLGCQIRMTPERDGMTITIPSGVNNFWS